MSKIAYNIKRLRTAKGITQEVFAKTVNVSRQAISSWETGRTQPDIEMIGTLADALGVSIEELIYGEKRNVKTDDTEKTYTSTATVVLSVLGGLMLLAGAILILVWSWEHIPTVAKTAFALVPMVLGAGFSVFVLIKMSGDFFMEELSAASWVLGNFASVVFVNELFEYNLGEMKIGLIFLALTLPVLLIMKSVSALTALYGIMAYVVNLLWEYTAESNVLTIAIVTGALAVGILFVAFNGKNLGYARYRYGQLITLLATIYYVYGIFVDYDAINPFVALLTVFASCNMVEKERDLTDPLYIFGTVGSMVTLFVCLYSGSEFVYGDSKTEVPVLALSAVAFAVAFFINKSSIGNNIFKKLQIAVIGAGALVSAGHSVVWMVTERFSSVRSGFDSFALFAFAFCIFALSVVFIMQGLKGNRLYSLNLGFASIAVLTIMLLTEFEADMLIKGCVLLIMGGILMFMNLKITRKKEKVKKLEETSAEENYDAQE